MSALTCSTCQAGNRPGAKFCDQCGAPLPPACPACGNAHRPGAKFCDQCGERLPQTAPTNPASAPPPPATRNLSQLIPPALMEKLARVQADATMVGERRVVTMLFCDVKGSTAAASALDPEEWAEIMNGAFRHLTAPVYRYEGTLARMMGDAILAFFGAPLAHEDDAQRAVLAGLEIAREMQPYAAEVQRRYAIDLPVRVGINTGLVMVGPVGSDLHMEYTAMGDAINLAARMEQTAQPGTVQIAEATYRLVAPHFEIEPLGAMAVKGKDQPVEAYRVLARRAAPARAPEREAPLTGRAAEMAHLRQVLAEVLAGQGQVVWLSGEAGLGKSRLIRELRAAWDAALQAAGTAGRWCETAGLSYEGGQPYGLFQRLMRAACEVGENEAAEALRSKLAGLAAQLPEAQRAVALPALEALFNLPTWPGASILEGEAFKQQLFRIMPALVQAWTAAGPLVLVFDDLHWADPASLGLLGHLLPLASQTRWLLLCALRPDPRGPAAALRASAQHLPGLRLDVMEVGPLSPAESEALVDRLLEAQPGRLEPSQRERILAQSEGNPLFIEEVAQALTDPANPGAEVEIPETLQSLLAARIDRLPEDARRTLQVAAIIGRTFEHRVLAAMLEPGAQLDARLRALEEAGLIQASGRRPGADRGGEYHFRHALVHEAAYQTILRRHRREFHRRAGEVLEALYPHRVEQSAPALGFHFAEAGEFGQALKYYLLAGDAAYRLFANAEALAHTTRAAELARRAGAAGEVLRHVYARRGRVLELSSNYKAALDNYAELEALGEQREEPALVLAAVAAQGQIRAMGSGTEADAVQAEALLTRALALAQQLNDRETEARVEWSRLQLFNWTEQIPEALAAGRRSIALARELGLSEQLAFTLNDLAYVSVGQPQQARAAVDEAIGLWRQLNNQPMLANSLTFASILRTQAGEIEPAIAFSDEAYQISAAIGNRWGMAFSRTAVGLSWWDRGEPAAAIRLMEAALADAEQAGFIVPKYSTRCFLAQTYAELGAGPRALDTLAELDSAEVLRSIPPRFLPLLTTCRMQVHLLNDDAARAEAIAPDHPAVFDLAAIRYVPGGAYQSLGMAGSVACQLRLARGQPGEAVRLANHYLALCQELQANRFVPDLLYWRGQAQAVQDDRPAARESWQQARGAAEAMECRRMLYPILLALSAVEAALGNRVDALGLEAAAQRVIAYIAERAADVGLHASFLRRVERVIAANGRV